MSSTFAFFGFAVMAATLCSLMAVITSKKLSFLMALESATGLVLFMLAVATMIGKASFETFPIYVVTLALLLMAISDNLAILILKFKEAEGVDNHETLHKLGLIMAGLWILITISGGVLYLIH